jgi:hypothetical protein
LRSGFSGPRDFLFLAKAASEARKKKNFSLREYHLALIGEAAGIASGDYPDPGRRAKTAGLPHIEPVH